MKPARTILVLTMAAQLLIGVSARAGMYTTATDENTAIPTGVGLASTITSSGFSGYIGSITIDLTISGGNNGDLYGYLSYDGVLVTLINRPGVSGSNPFGAAGSGFNVSITDNGFSGSIQASGGAPGSMVTGFYSAADGANALGTAYGSGYKSANGTWTLYLENEVSGGDSSELVSWSVAINPVPEPTNVALGIFGVCAIAGRARLAWKKSRQASKPVEDRK